MKTRGYARPWLVLAAAAALGQPMFAQDAPQPRAPRVPAPAPNVYSGPGLFTVRTIDETWHDDARNRDVPVRIYLPAARGGGIAVSARLPVVVFSPGLGASRVNYGYFGNHLASHGYLVITPTHAGSDTAAMLGWLREHEKHAGDEKEAGGKDAPGDKGDKGDKGDTGPSLGWLMDSINDPDSLMNRPRDISFVIDQAATRPTVSAVADLDKVGVAGHSFGAYTAMAVGGMLVDLPGAPDTSFRDDRVKAVLPMSPEGHGTMGIDEHSWDHFAVPVLFLTGTKDYGAGGRAAAWRREAFDSIHGVDSYLATIDGATHMTFGGMGAAPEGADDPAHPSLRDRVREKILEKLDDGRLIQPDPDQAAHLQIVRDLSVAFFDAYLKGDPEAKEWLRTNFAAEHGDAKTEFHPAEPRP